MRKLQILESIQCTNWIIKLEFCVITNNDIIEKAFGIGLVFEKIFEDSKDFKSLMELRLVCQLFNRGCLQIIKNSFQKVQIEVDETKIPEEREAELYNQWDHILINGIDLKISTNKELDELLPFIKFLKNDIDVVVKQLRLKGLYKLDNKYYKKIHWDVFHELIGENCERLTELIGIEDICPLGCEDCAKFGDRCKKYGPVQYNALVNGFNKQQHFTELLISDRFLYRIVEHVTDTEKSKEEVMESMKKMIPSITCDHLVITFTETMNSSGDLTTNGYRDGYFTELKFDAPIGTLNGFEDLKFSHLEIDLSDSKEYLKVLEIDGRIDGYNNLYSNARQNPTARSRCHMSSLMILNGRKLTISFVEDHHLRHKYQKMIGLNSNYRKTFNNVQFIGKRYMLHEEKANNVINVDLWVEKEPFENYCHTLTPWEPGAF